VNTNKKPCVFGVDDVTVFLGWEKFEKTKEKLRDWTFIKGVCKFSRKNHNTRLLLAVFCPIVFLNLTITEATEAYEPLKFLKFLMLLNLSKLSKLSNV
jgi:hypothetical protein